MAVILRTLRRSAANVWAALCFAAVAPLLLGSVILSRFDLWPAALVAGALAALVSGRLRLGHALLGLGVAAKLYPGVLVPLGVAFAWKRRGPARGAHLSRRSRWASSPPSSLPFVILSPDGVWHSLSVQLTRPLQVESLGSALLLVGHHVFGLGVTGETSHGSQNLAGNAADVARGRLDRAAGGRADLDLGRRSHAVGATPKRSFAPPRPRSVRSSRSGRCCRRSS